MADDSELIETGIDRLLGYVQEREKVQMEEAAKSLGAESETVEKWATALEDSGLIKIHYSARRGMILEASKEDSEKVEKVLKDTAENLREMEELREEQTEMEQFHDILERMEEALEEDEKKAEELEEVLKGENLVTLREYLEEVRRTEDEVEHLEESIEDLTHRLQVLMKVEDMEDSEEEKGLLERLKGLLPGEEDSGQKFKCGDCGKEFDTERGLKTHRGMVHDE